MSEKEVEEVWSEIKLLEDEKEKPKDRLERVRELEDLEERLMMENVKNVDLESQRSRDHDLKELKIKLEIEKMKLANEEFVENKVSQPSNDKETPREYKGWK
ncbi:unnamed protein product [Lepeophtheirus salmonis]|uniref:(salmon louse) hypothetical protein n=1 Tax=Lepeophtheirus salmonis TaxID=72036 RepID=A0A7R8HD73_LEPSM|nr:unnamed protein product [Lepeophtheirus salmonis]CAF3004501.1 unnamed protein product [Lepeophtheirus salmonis]